MPSTDELYFMRALERCEKQLSAGFTDPLDSAQVRRLANIEHLLSEYGRRDGSSRNGKCQSRVDSVKKGAQPWIEKRDALVESLRTIHALKPNADETADTGGKDASPVSASNAEVKGNAESQNAEDSSSSSSSSVVADSRPAEPAPAVQAPTGTNADADQSQTENKRGDPKPKAAEEPKSTRKERSGFAEKRQELFGEMEGLRRRGVVPDTVEGVERLLKSQRATQEDLTSDLVTMASMLKKNSMAFGDIAEKDKAIVEETAEALSSNLANIGKQGGRLNKYRKQAWGTTGMTWLAVLVVVCVFFILVLFMRIAPKRY